MKHKRSSPFDPRQYMISPDFEIFYYNDLHFQSVGSHSHDYYEFYFFEEGEVSMVIGKQVCPLHAGDVLVVPPGTPHQANILDPEIPYRRFVFWISAAYLDQLYQEAAEYRCLPEKADKGICHYHFDLLSFNEIRSALFSLLEEQHTEQFGRQEAIRLRIRLLLLLLSRLVTEQEEDARPEVRSKYGSIINYIDLHVSEPLTLEKIAGELYLNKYYIAHLFQENTGMSVHRYIIKKRLALCLSAIKNGQNISEAYISCGFQDYSSFYRAFIKEYGMPPSSYKTLNTRP